MSITLLVIIKYGAVVDNESYLGWSDAKEMPIKKRNTEPATRLFYFASKQHEQRQRCLFLLRK